MIPNGPEDPTLPDPNDFGSREFWKAANHHAVRRWAEMADENVKLKGLLNWAETLLCNAKPMEHCSQEEWDKVITQFRNRVNPAYRA